MSALYFLQHALCFFAHAMTVRKSSILRKQNGTVLSLAGIRFVRTRSAKTQEQTSGTCRYLYPLACPALSLSYRPRKRQKLLSYFTNAAFWRYSALSAEALNISSIIWSSVYLLPSELVLSRSHCGVSISTKKFFILFLWN